MFERAKFAVQTRMRFILKMLFKFFFFLIESRKIKFPDSQKLRLHNIQEKRTSVHPQTPETMNRALD